MKNNIGGDAADSIGLTDSEARYLQMIKRTPSSAASRLLGWGVELSLSIGMFAYGWYADQKLFLLAGFLSSLYFAAFRMYAQFRGATMLRSIYEKQQLATNKMDEG